MARYDFTNDNGLLKIVIQSQGGLYNPQSMSLATPSLSLTNNIIKVYNSGKYIDSYFLTDIGLIAGVQPTDINQAFEALTDLIALVLA
jgi:hypothetical protein